VLKIGLTDPKICGPTLWPSGFIHSFSSRNTLPGVLLSGVIAPKERLREVHVEVKIGKGLLTHRDPSVLIYGEYFLQ
jgi:hypothetical protein